MDLLPHQKVESLTNVQTKNLIIKYLRFFAVIVGLDVYVLNHKLNWQYVLVVVITHPVIVSFFFLLFSDVTVNEKMEAFCTSLVMWQGAHKFWSTFFCSDYYHEILQQIDNLHARHVRTPELAAELKKIGFYWCIISEILCVCYFSVALVYYLYPALMWLVFHEQVTIIPIPLPIIDWHKPIGYTINIIHQMWVISYGVVGLVAADTLFLYQILHTIGYLKVFKYRIKQLDKLLESWPQDLREIEAQLKECIRAHQDYITYIEMVDGNYSQVCMGQMVTGQFILIISLFITLWSHWIVGPFLAVGALFQLLEYCILGTIVTIQNENASDIIYNMSWYLLPVRLQRLVILMIQRGQEATELSVGSFAQLNVETAMQVIKTTYSYLMMMLEFIG